MSQQDLELHENIHETNDFASFLLRNSLSVTNLMRRKNLVEIPFDIACPSLKDILNSRVCSECGIYFSSISSYDLHCKFCNKEKVVVPTRIQPKRIASIRQNEKMVIWASRLNDLHIDWFDSDEILENEGQSMNEIAEEKEEGENDLNEDGLPIIDVEKYFESPFVE